jgi:hypothetical protein
MRLHPAQQRTGRSSGKGANPAYRAASRRRPRPRRVGRRRTAGAAGRTRRKRRQLLLFYALMASVAGELAAIVVDLKALVLLFSLTGIFLLGMLFQETTS